MKQLAIALLIGLSAHSQINKQPILDKGYSIASITDSAIVTNPMEIYTYNNFHVFTRLIVKADTVIGQYATGRQGRYQWDYAWSPIRDSKQCRKTWPVFRDFLAYWDKQKKL